MTGLLYMFPFAIFAVVPLVVFISNRFRASFAKDDLEKNDQRSFAWITLNLGGAFIISFLLLTIFFWSGMRYAADFLPLLTMLSAIGFWQGYRLVGQKTYYRIAGIMLACISIFISTLLAISTA